MDSVSTIFAAAIVSLTGAVVYLWRMILDLQKSESSCNVKMAALEIEFRYAKEALKRFQLHTYTYAPIMITASLPDGRIVEINEAIEDLLGWKAHEVIGKNIAVLIPEEFHVLHEEGVAKAAERGHIRPGSIGIQAFGLHKSGAKIPVSVNLTEKSKAPWLIVAQMNYRVL